LIVLISSSFIKSGQEPSDHSIIVRKRTLSCRVVQAAEGIDLLGDIYASKSYRAQLVKVYTKRATSEQQHSIQIQGRTYEHGNQSDEQLTLNGRLEPDA